MEKQKQVQQQQQIQIKKQNKYVVINADELRLRIEPFLDSDIFKWKDGTNRHPKKGEKYLYLGEYGDFYKIDLKVTPYGFPNNTLSLKNKKESTNH